MYNPVAQKFLRTILSNHSWAGTADNDFVFRLSAIFQHLYGLYEQLYGHRPNWQEELTRLTEMLHDKYKKRPDSMRASDLYREQHPEWFTSEKIAGMMLYVDRFNKDLPGVEKKLSYFEELGINLLHLMPLFESPDKKNDGGYAVSNYRKVDSRFGSTYDLKVLADRLHKKKMYLMLDLVINHTSDEHAWAKAARKGDKDYQKFYYTFDDRTVPDLFERTLPEVFPENAPGNFTWSAKMKKWVMTVFNEYQWDLNYTNPRVLTEMTDILLDVANMGVDVFRLDAVAFLWKKMGTNSQNLPEAHIILKIMKACTQVVAPGVVYLAEAIVAPNEILKYFGKSQVWSDECDLAYNATLMALMWDAVSTRNSRMVHYALERLPHKPKGTTWINYLRCHDDIGLGYDDGDIHYAGYTPKLHRKFMVAYLTGAFDGSFARGMPFMVNPKTGDARISGSLASLAGLEEALEQNDAALEDLALSRIIMMHGIIIAYAGIPMIYYGDEIGTLNDYSFVKHPEHQDDNRWVHRPVIDWKKAAKRNTVNTPESRIFNGIAHMLKKRRENPVMRDTNNVKLLDLGNEHLLSFARLGEPPVLVVANLTEEAQHLETSALFQIGIGSSHAFDILSGKKMNPEAHGIPLGPYEIFWMTVNQ